MGTLVSQWWEELLRSIERWSRIVSKTMLQASIRSGRSSSERFMPQSASPRTPRRSERNRSTTSSTASKSPSTNRQRRRRRSSENSDVLVSAVISTYLLTHLHHVLQRAEYGAVQEGRQTQAANYAQLRKVLCMDARSMEDASALGRGDDDIEIAA